MAPQLVDMGKYKVADISLADFGRKELNIAESEMPGLMTIRKKHGDKKPFKGLKIMGSLHMTIQTAALMETLVALGADVRWCSCNIFSTQDHAAAAMAKAGIAVFAWKGESLKEYWDCTWNAICYPGDTGPDQIVDDGGDTTLLIHRGYQAENDASILEEGNDNEEMKVINTLIKNILKEKPGYFHKIIGKIRGVSEETTTGVHRLVEMAQNNTLQFPAVNVNDCVTKSKFDNLYGCRHSLVDSIMRATDKLLSGMKCYVAGFGDVGKGSCESLASQKCRVVVGECDPICALQACMTGYTVAPIEDVVKECDVFVTATGNKDVITVKHMQQMKDLAVVCNIGHFDSEIAYAELKKVEGIKRTTIKPQVDMWTFPDGHSIILLAEGRLVNLGCATGHPSSVMDCSFSNQTLAQLEIAKGAYKKPDVYLLPKHLDEEVARMQLSKFGAKLVTLTNDQAKYINVPVSGPYKPQTYRY